MSELVNYALTALAALVAAVVIFAMLFVGTGGILARLILLSHAF